MSARLVLQASRRHAWVVPRETISDASGIERLRVRGAVDLAPGDEVLVDPSGVVRERLERRSFVRRKTGRGVQVLAANVDDLMVMSAAGLEGGGEGLLARCIAAAREGGATPLLVFNKADLDEDGSLERQAGRWERLGFETRVISVLVGTGIEPLRSRLSGRFVALVGSSGVGKSTLINVLAPGASQKTAEVGAGGRGRHTTTLGRAIPWEGGLLIDLPGLRSFGLVDDAALHAAYPDIEAAAQGCRFADCAHGPEPGCGVREAVARGEVEPERLESWRRLRQSIIEGREGGPRPGRAGPR